MVVSEIKDEDIIKYELVKKDNYVLIGLYDTDKVDESEVTTEIFAYMYVTNSNYKKKNILTTDGGITMLKPSLALLKVIEIELAKYLKANKISFIETYLNNDLDITKCGLKPVNDTKLLTPVINQDTKYFRIYKNKITKYTNI